LLLFCSRLQHIVLCPSTGQSENLISRNSISPFSPSGKHKFSILCVFGAGSPFNFGTLIDDNGIQTYNVSIWNAHREAVQLDSMSHLSSWNTTDAASIVTTSLRRRADASGSRIAFVSQGPAKSYPALRKGFDALMFEDPGTASSCIIFQPKTYNTCDGNKKHCSQGGTPVTLLE
jgi:hypothetical protein